MRFQHSDPFMPTLTRSALPPAGPIHEVSAPAPHTPVIAAVLGALDVAPPAVVVSLDCACADTTGPLPEDGVLAIGAELDEALAIFRPVVAPAGDAARPWAHALALLDDSFGGDAPFEDLPLFEAVPLQAIVEARLERRAHRGVDAMRLQDCFEAVAAIALDGDAGTIRPGAMQWNALAASEERGRYRYEIVRAARPWQIDLRAAVRDVVFEILGGESPARVSARFQNTVAAALGDVVRAIGGARGRAPVLLSGSCFRAGPLASRLLAELAGDYDVLMAP